MARPRIAIMKITHNTPDRLVLSYNPLAYPVLGGTFALLCLVAFFGTSGVTSLIWLGAALLFGGAFTLLFYRRVTLTLDRPSNTITHAKVLALVSKSSTTYPLNSLQTTTVDTSFTGDTALHRAVLVFDDDTKVPVTRPYLSGPNGIEVSTWINEWLTSLDSSPPQP